MDKCDKVYIALDSDAREKQDKISQLFISYGVDVYRIDASGFGDVGEMDQETFQIRKKTAEVLSLDDYLMERILYQ